MSLITVRLSAESQKTRGRIDSIYTSFSKLCRLKRYQTELMFSLPLAKTGKYLLWILPEGVGHTQMPPCSPRLGTQEPNPLANPQLVRCKIQVGGNGPLLRPCPLQQRLEQVHSSPHLHPCVWQVSGEGPGIHSWQSQAVRGGARESPWLAAFHIIACQTMAKGTGAGAGVNTLPCLPLCCQQS